MAMHPGLSDDFWAGHQRVRRCGDVPVAVVSTTIRLTMVKVSFEVDRWLLGRSCWKAHRSLARFGRSRRWARGSALEGGCGFQGLMMVMMVMVMAAMDCVS